MDWDVGNVPNEVDWDHLIGLVGTGYEHLSELYDTYTDYRDRYRTTEVAFEIAKAEKKAQKEAQKARFNLGFGSGRRIVMDVASKAEAGAKQDGASSAAARVIGSHVAALARQRVQVTGRTSMSSFRRGRGRGRRRGYRRRRTGYRRGYRRSYRRY